MKIEKTEYSYQVTECDLKFGEQITLDGELLISASVFDKIKAEIMSLDYIDEDKYEGTSIDPQISRDDVFEIIDQYMAENKEYPANHEYMEEEDYDLS